MGVCFEISVKSVAVKKALHRNASPAATYVSGPLSMNAVFEAEIEWAASCPEDWRPAIAVLLLRCTRIAKRLQRSLLPIFLAEISGLQPRFLAGSCIGPARGGT